MENKKNFLKNVTKYMGEIIVVILCFISCIIFSSKTSESDLLPAGYQYGTGYFNVYGQWIPAQPGYFDEQGEFITQTSENALYRKKEMLLKVSAISFHYVDEKKIRDFYNDYFKELELEQLVSEIVGEISGDIKAQVPEILEGSVSGKKLRKWSSQYKIPDPSLSGMFKRFQNATIENDQVTLGLELLIIESGELNCFNSLVATLEKRFDLTIDKEILDKHREKLKRKSVENTIKRLENVTDWVLIEENFKIMDFSEDYYKLVFYHPVNEYIKGEGQEITISATVKKDSIEPSVAGNYMQSIGQEIPLKIYGNVWRTINLKTKVVELIIEPFAIY